MFERELEFYKANRADLLKRLEGRHVIIKGKDLFGDYSSEAEAYRAGIFAHGRERFLIKHVTAEEETVRIPAPGKGSIALFKKELAWYADNVGDLPDKIEGRYIVVKGDKLLGDYASESEAYGAGLREYGNTCFLVQQVGEERETGGFPAQSIGVLNANMV